TARCGRDGSFPPAFCSCPANCSLRHVTSAARYSRSPYAPARSTPGPRSGCFCRSTATAIADRLASSDPRASPAPAPVLGLRQSWVSVPLQDAAPALPSCPLAAERSRPVRLALCESWLATAQWHARQPQPHPTRMPQPPTPPIAGASAHPSEATANDTSFRSTEWRWPLASPG